MDWISVDERLPEIGERVLAKDDLGGICIGYCKKENLFDLDAFLEGRFVPISRKYISIEGGSQFGAIPNAKYWMPIPDRPVDPDSIVEEMRMAIARDELRRWGIVHAMFERLRNGEGGEVKFAPFEKLPEAKEEE